MPTRPQNVDAPRRARAGVAFVFECPYCGWKGTQPVLDAHLHAFCPTCGKPAEFEEVLRLRRAR